MSWLSSSSSSPRESLPDLDHSNLESFLHTVTPIVPARRSLLQLDLNASDLNNGDENDEYFYLSDLWESYYEWSAYGVGSPIVWSNGERVMQYYAPYLSALQLFTAKSPSPISVNKDGAELEAESSLSDDLESDKSSRQSSDFSKTWDVDSGDLNTDRHEKNCCDNLCFEFFDTCPPYLRVPLIEKVLGFSRRHPGIMSFKSTDLSPASWMAIAWYPIYHIPFKQTIKDLSACFLTFHTLSSSYQEVIKDNEDEDVEVKWSKKSCKPGLGRIILPPFALATFKLQGEVWRNPFNGDEERFHDLHCAAYSWLKQLNVQHHDFNFFTLQSNNIRMRNGRGMICSSMYNYV